MLVGMRVKNAAWLHLLDTMVVVLNVLFSATVNLIKENRAMVVHWQA